jgi:hypothetical protein
MIPPSRRCVSFVVANSDSKDDEDLLRFDSLLAKPAIV